MDILYRVSWTMPGEPEHSAVMDHGASMSLAAALEPLGAVVYRFPPDRPAGRQLAAQSRDDATGAGGLDAGDRAAMGRLARRALYSPVERHDEDR